MNIAFNRIVFNEAGAAEQNLEILGGRLPARLWAALPTLLAQVPNPDDALNFLERYTRESPPEVNKHIEAHPAALHYLLALFSHSRFLSESLVQQPELILWLDRREGSKELQRMKTRDDLAEECQRFAATAGEMPTAVMLARFKRREYLRITLRDVLGIATLAETTRELSDLADVIIERTLEMCAEALEKQYGRPMRGDGTGARGPARLTVISLGKLGGQELNYSSDIDLMFLYDEDGETAGGASGGTGGEISNLEYFVRLAQAILKILTTATPEGAVFRIDLRLRPEGRQGGLAVSLGAALDYYRRRGREWEMQMLIKARVSAGGAAAGEKFLREMYALIFPQGFHTAALEAMLQTREEISRALRSEAAAEGEYAAEWNVKLSPGGIRDIEFLAQCLQRLHGGRDAWLTGRGSGSTLVALQRLHDKGYLSQRDFYRLGSAYQLLRKVEHRLQLRDGLQEHTLPSKRGALDRIARRCGIEPANGRAAGEMLLERVREAFDEVQDIYARVLPGAEQEASAGTLEMEEPARRRDAALLAADPLQARLRGDFPALGAQLEKHREEGDVFTRRGVEKFLEAALADTALLDELETNPDWLERAAVLCGRSDWMAETLARSPRAIHEIAHAGDFDAPRLPFPQTMASLRDRQHRAALRIAARSLLGEMQPCETFAELTRAMEESIRDALALAAEEEMRGVELAKAPFAVLALGRLGSGEFDAGSDADLVFLTDASVRENEIYRWRRVAERFIHVAGSYTRDGLLVAIDTRLRPRGGEGEIVQPAAYLLEYFSREAEGWEAAMSLKARAVAGNLALGQKIAEELRAVVARRYAAGGEAASRELREQLAHTRMRLEQERPEGRWGFQTSAGGYFDIEYATALLILERGMGDENLGDIRKQIARLEAAGALDAGSARTMSAAALLYRAMGHAIRLVMGRPLSQLPEPAQLPRIETLLELWHVPMEGTIRETIGAMRKRVREVYENVFRARET